MLTSKQQLAQSAEFRLPQGKTLLVLLSLQDTREPSQLPSSQQRERVERFQTKARSTGNILSWTVFINPPEAGRHSHHMVFMVMTMSSSFRRMSSFMSSTFSRTNRVFTGGSWPTSALAIETGRHYGYAALCVFPHCKVSIGQYNKMCTSPLIFSAPLFQMTNI